MNILTIQDQGGFMLLPVTTTFLSGILLLATILSMRVSAQRKNAGITSGDEGNIPLRRRIQAHCNFTENAPFMLFIILVLEYTQAPKTLLVGVAITLFISRLSHAVSVEIGGKSIKYGAFLLFIAMMPQHLLFLSLSVWLIFRLF